LPQLPSSELRERAHEFAAKAKTLAWRGEFEQQTREGAGAVPKLGELKLHLALGWLTAVASAARRG
jgi:hypothetical protein